MAFDREQAREWGRKGAAAKWARVRAAQVPIEPLGGTVLDLLGRYGEVFADPSWDAWRAVWKSLHGLALTPSELNLYVRHTGRSRLPAGLVREAWVIVGRRGGKSRAAALEAVYAACCRDYRSVLSPGEKGVVMIVAADRLQARVVFRYLTALIDGLPELRRMVVRRRREALELATGVTIEVHTASYRTTRGYTVVAAILDEVAFWHSEDSSNPDSDILTALRPGMATVPGSLLLSITTPYARRGEVWKAYDRFWGQDSAGVLVWRAATVDMNPTMDLEVIERAYEDDPAAAAAEYGGEFRRDVEALLAVEAVEAVRVLGRRELAPVAGQYYAAFVDPSGGSQDSFTLAIAHLEEKRAILDVVRERRPPFSPDDVVAEYAALLRSYGVSAVQGDRYGGEWPRERFRAHGVTYTPSERVKSDLYRELVAPLNAGRVELLDVPALKAQLVGLERRVARSGKDSVDHAPGGHDDVANAAAGALTMALGREDRRWTWSTVTLTGHGGVQLRPRGLTPPGFENVPPGDPLKWGDPLLHKPGG